MNKISIKNITNTIGEVLFYFQFISYGAIGMFFLIGNIVEKSSINTAAKNQLLLEITENLKTPLYIFGILIIIFFGTKIIEHIISKK